MNNKQILLYSLLAFPLAFISLPIYIYLPQFYEKNFAVSLQSIGLILIIVRVIDAVQDPIFGILSDKFYNLKKQLIFYFAPFLGISFLLLFYPLVQTQIALWLFVFLILTYSFYSIIQINYQSFAVDLSDDYNTKTKIIAIREFVGVFGVIAASVAPALLFLYFDEVKSYLFISIFYFFIITIFAAIFYFKVDSAKLTKQKFDYDFSFLKSKKMKKFFAVFFFNGVALTIPAALILFFVDKVIKLPNFTGLFLLIYFTGLLIGIPFWTKFSQKIDNKIKTWLISMVLVIFIFIWCYFLGENDLVSYALICLFSGFCFGTDYCISFSVLTDIIQEEKIAENKTTIFGIANFISKFCLSVTSGILVFLLGVVRESEIFSEVGFLKFSYVILPCLFKVFAMLTLFSLLKSYEKTS